MDYISPKHILVELLRKHVQDPRSDREKNINKEEITLSEDTRVVKLSESSLSYVDSVEVDGEEKKKFVDYYVDYKNAAVIFYEELSSTQEVSISYEYGKNWIYPDKPMTTLSAEEFPRINLGTVSMTGSRLGNYEAPVESRATYQVDIWVKTNQKFSVSENSQLSKTMSGDELGEYLAYQCMKAIEDNIDELHPYMFHYQLMQGPTELPFNQDYMSFHYSIEFQLSSINIGRIGK